MLALCIRIRYLRIAQRCYWEGLALDTKGPVVCQEKFSTLAGDAKGYLVRLDLAWIPGKEGRISAGK